MAQKVLLDTNFIMACVDNKIDFIGELQFLGMEVLIPNQVFDELEDIILSKQKMHSRDDASLVLRVLEEEEGNFEKIDIPGSYLDNAIVAYAKQHKEIIIATLDKGLRSKISNKKLAIRNRKTFELL